MERSPRLAALAICSCLSLVGCRVPSGGEGVLRFVVLGDGRGWPDGTQRPIFPKILDDLQHSAPAFVLHTGDMISGQTTDASALRQQWKAYRSAISAVPAPLFHVPGNHDIFDDQSARIWKEVWGPTYYAFDRGPARVIALDTETLPGRVGDTQFAWLAEQLATSGSRMVFITLHQPLFPTEAHVGSSLDAYPTERDRLHALFVKYQPRIKGIFQGHEHLYHHETRDGLPYYIIGGAGADLYAPPDLGGFYHYAVVDAGPGGISVTIKKMVARPEPAESARSIQADALLESWERGLFWYPWDSSVHRELTREHASDGAQGLKLWFDFSLYETPLLYTVTAPARDLTDIGRVTVDVFVPAAQRDRLSAQMTIEDRESHEAPPVPLAPGWNQVHADLDGAWLPAEARRAVQHIQWKLSSPKTTSAGWVVFDNLRLTPRSRTTGGTNGEAPLRIAESARRNSESWEGGLLWGVWPPTPIEEFTSEFSTHGERGLKLRFDFEANRQHRVYAPLEPAWNLTSAESLAVDVYAPAANGGIVSAHLAVTGPAGRHEAPQVQLRPGWNVVRATLDGPWIPRVSRQAAERIEVVFRAGDPASRAGWVVLDRLRSESQAQR